jgi:hypothetical protein
VAESLLDKAATHASSYMQPGLEYVCQKQKPWFYVHRTQLVSTWTQDFLRWRRARNPKGHPRLKALRGWQITVFRLIQQLMLLDDPRRHIIDITGVGNVGKGTFLEQLATPEAWPFMNAAVEFPGVCDITQLKDTDGFCLFYCGQGVCYADYSRGRKGSLHTRPAAAAVIETATDYDRTVYSPKYAGCSVLLRSHVTIVAGNEDVSGDLYNQKVVYKFEVANDPHDENAWQRMDRVECCGAALPFYCASAP